LSAVACPSPLLFAVWFRDYFEDPVHRKDPEENRAATVVMYLGDVEEGGETTLPLGIPIDPARQVMHNPSE
jgi:hypothetical protein